MNFGKKGSESEMWTSDTVLMWIVFGVVLGFTAVVFVLIISHSGAEKAKIYENLESLTLIQRFFTSPNCFIYESEGIMLPRAIDFEKFTEQRLNSCYNINQNNFPAFRLTLFLDTLIMSKTIKTSNWNDNRNFEEKTVPRNIAVFYQSKWQNGRVEIEIQNIR
ncbi:MAG: hypothetical protein AABX33_07880 [Nanoarchaeota archaeon]